MGSSDNASGPTTAPPEDVVITGDGSEHVSEAPETADGRWLWVPPTLIVLGIGVFALVQVLPGQSHPNRQERLLARANTVCEAHTPAGLSLSYATPMTAGAVAAAARFLYNSPTPWNKLPDDHFVAKCSYSDVQVAATSQYIPCASGNGLVSVYQPTRILIDEDGRSSPDSVTPSDC
jgi:hypothetical protein